MLTLKYLDHAVTFSDSDIEEFQISRIAKATIVILVSNKIHPDLRPWEGDLRIEVDPNTVLLDRRMQLVKQQVYIADTPQLAMHTKFVFRSVC